MGTAGMFVRMAVAMAAGGPVLVRFLFSPPMVALRCAHFAGEQSSYEGSRSRSAAN